MKKFDTILWDVDGTLLNFKKSEEYAVRFCFEHFSLEVSDEIIEQYAKINDDCWKKLELGILNKQQVLIGRFEELFKRLNITTVQPAEFQELYKDALGSVFYYQDDSYTLCKELKQSMRQYIVTNGITYTQTKKLKLAGFYDVMDGVFISEEVGCPKPNKEFFDQCFEMMGEVDLTRTIIIGDSLTSDMRGGNHCGIATCWYNPAGLKNDIGVTIDYEITSLSQIKDFL